MATCGTILMTVHGCQQEISFQMFRNQLLANGLVEKLEVSNKNLVKVYVRSSAPSMGAEGSLRSGTVDGSAGSGAVRVPPGQPPSVYKYYFHIGSVDSFERKMEEAQEALGITLGEEVRWLQGSGCCLLPGCALGDLHFPCSPAAVTAAARGGAAGSGAPESCKHVTKTLHTSHTVDTGTLTSQPPACRCRSHTSTKWAGSRRSCALHPRCC